MVIRVLAAAMAVCVATAANASRPSVSKPSDKGGVMTPNEEIQKLEAEISFIQNEIDRRRERVDEGQDRMRNLEKIDALRAQKNELGKRLAELKEA